MTKGRPLKYKTPEDMKIVIDEYFGEGGGAYMKMGDTDMYAPTVSGLAYALHMSTEALRNYEEKDGFLATVKDAKLRIELALEQRLYGQAVTGTIFNLKNNFGWKDKTEREVDMNVNIKGLPDEALDARIKELQELQNESSS